MVDFFLWVGEASPWLWLALGIALLALEILAPSFVLIWPGLAAMVMALLAWLAPRFSGEATLALFAGLSIALLFGGRALMARIDQAEPQSILNARGKNMVGRKARVLSVSGPQGKVEIDGVQWPATWEDGTSPEVGSWVLITQSTGLILSATSPQR
ncbi:MAG: NfeD family protein [Rhodobacteraceae bacterium]|nr:NfeD family protein [Paracoccaceae bacterium]